MNLSEERLLRVADRFEEIDARLSVASDGGEIMRLSKERAKLAPVADAIRALKSKEKEFADLQELIETLPASDEMAQMAQEEMPQVKEDLEKLKGELQILLLPRDEDDDASVILELRAGTGGDEAALFVGDLYRMYQRYAERQGWKLELDSLSEGDAGGFKEIIATINGDGVFGKLKFESGTHRVQRVPATEAQGRVHTSAATVAVLPVPEETNIEVHDKDIRIDTYRSSGAGGQHVNKTDSAVRITHIPSGIVVTASEKSQHQNRANAMKNLIARLYEKEREEKAKARSDARASQVGSGDRSEKIRTYNFPQGRVSDHRINLTLYKLDDVLDGGGLGDFVTALIADDTAKRLAEAEEGQ
ncbi:peptide chain release factor 1 [Pseudaquidulcibacter saccharophilus]|uniref:peptide chain release factor 1 n=1 Tax=Pseudaquidulcibacter saccharophilus TaxID=2831900 RepID=UPI001EFF509A|nr:peptide chain release factor 1 [Pseudaquidulcibacter saccharophilus]